MQDPKPKRTPVEVGSKLQPATGKIEPLIRLNINQPLEVSCIWQARHSICCEQPSMIQLQSSKGTLDSPETCTEISKRYRGTDKVYFTNKMGQTNVLSTVM